MFGTSERNFRADVELTYLGKTQNPTQKYWSDADLPIEIRDIIHKLDDAAWRGMRENLAKRIGDADLVAVEQPRHVFVSYRESEIGKDAARRIEKYLHEKGLPTWFFPYQVRWGENQYKAMEDAIASARAAVVVFTSDFAKGAMAQEEYYSLIAKRNSDKTFTVGLFLVGAKHEDVPVFMKQYFYVSVTDINDSTFEAKMASIYRGILGLPLENR